MTGSEATSRAIKILSTVSYFADVDETILATLAAEAAPRTYGRDQVIFWEGELGEGLFVVESGWLKIVKISPDGREQAIHFLGPGEEVNAMSVFAEIPNPATAIALEPAVVWMVGRDIILRFLEDHPKMALVVIRKLAGRVQHLVALVEDLSLRTVEARLARLLLELDEEGMVHRRRWATQTELASRLGTVPDVLSRALRKLSAEGLVRVSRHQIQILDAAGLEDRAKIE